MRHGESVAWSVVLALVLSGCVAAGNRVSRAELQADASGWTTLETLPTLRQKSAEDCGETVLAMLLRHWDRPADPLELRAASGQPESRGLRAGYMRDRLRAAGLEAFLLAGTPGDLAREIAAGRPVILGIARPGPVDAVAHYVLVVGVQTQRGQVLVADPDAGLRAYSPAVLNDLWAPTGKLMIVAARRPSAEGSASTGRGAARLADPPRGRTQNRAVIHARRSGSIGATFTRRSDAEAVRVTATHRTRGLSSGAVRMWR
ncbi:MAG: cysteine peptidase family C39 domain-containing protein [Bradymonadia bacterium]